MNSPPGGPPPDDEVAENRPHKKRYDTFDPDPRAVAKKRVAHRQQAASERGSQRKRRILRVTLLSAVLVMALSLALRSILVPSAETTLEMPTNLVGVWTTEDPRYSSRKMTIRIHSLEFVVPGEQVQRYRIEEVKRSSSEKDVVFTIRTVDDSAGVVHQHALVSSLDNRRALQFQNRPGVVWNRQR